MMQAPPSLPPPVQLLQMITVGRMTAQAIGVAARLDFATQIGDGKKTAAELAQACGCNVDGVYRVLRALASVGLFTEAEGGFRNTPLSSTLRDGPMSSRPLALFFCHEAHVKAWIGLDHSVRTGGSGFEHVLGKSPFELAASDPEIGKVFNDAMTAFSAAMGPAIAEACDLSGIDQLVDLGGGHGQLLATILSRYPTMRGILFDLPQVVAGAKSVIEPMANRIEVIAGDFFREVPAAPAYIMKNVLHDWSDADALRILQTIHRAARPNARVILAEAVLQPGNDPDIAKFMDLEMLVAGGGRERDLSQWTDLLRDGGFRLERTIPTTSPAVLLEATRV